MQVNLFQLQEKHVNNLFVSLSQKKYEWLLFSFMLLIFGNSFSVHHHLIGVTDIYQNLLIGLVIFYNKKPVRHLILCIILVSVGLDLYQLHFSYSNFKSWHGILYLIFFVVVSKEVYKDVLFVKTVSSEMLAGVLCGFVLLCLIATFLFLIIETEVPHSFTNLGDTKDAMNNLNYFSFTTLLTIGYGDITPASLIAKRAVMLIGLAGHFYTVFVTSIIIGKYLSLKKG